MKQVALRLADKRKDDYAAVANYIRTKIRFALLKSVLISLRGVRGKQSGQEHGRCSSTVRNAMCCALERQTQSICTTVNKETDLGIVMTGDLKASSNVTECVKRANQTLEMIKRAFSYLDETSFVQLYKVFVRPQLEYCQQAVNPTSANDINLVERVQRRATKLVPGLDGMDYESRLKALNLYSMEERRVRGLHVVETLYSCTASLTLDRLSTQ